MLYTIKVCIIYFFIDNVKNSVGNFVRESMKDLNTVVMVTVHNKQKGYFIIYITIYRNTNSHFKDVDNYKNTSAK